MRRAVFLLPFTIAAGAAPALAQSAPPPADAPPAEAVTAALALFEDRDLEQQMRASVAHMTDASLKTQLEMISAEGKELPEKAVVRLRELLAEQGELVIKDVMPTIRMELAAIYARRFTAEELRELKALQARPVMKKAEKLMPEMFAEMSRIGGKAAAARMPALQKKIQEMVEEVAAEEAVAEAAAT